MAIKNGDISDKCQSAITQSQLHLLAMSDSNLLCNSSVNDALEQDTSVESDTRNEGFSDDKLREKSAPRKRFSDLENGCRGFDEILCKENSESKIGRRITDYGRKKVVANHKTDPGNDKEKARDKKRYGKIENT